MKQFFIVSPLLAVCILLTWRTAQGSSCLHDFCANPKDSDLDQKWLYEDNPGGWNYQFGNADGRRRLANLLHGKQLSFAEVDDREMCSRVSIDFAEDQTGGQISGFGNKTADWTCRMNSTTQGYDCEVHSTEKPDFSFPLKVYYAYFDSKENQNIIVDVYCFNDGVVSWQALSKSKTITDAERKVVYDHLKEQGFDPENSVELSHDKCK